MKPPKNDVLTLFVIFLGIPLCVFFLLVFKGQGNWDTIELLQILILHSSLALVYIASYPAAQAHSPSLSILLIIGSSAKGHLTAEEINRQYTTDQTIIRRVDELEIYGMIEKRDNVFILKPIARVIIRLYIFYRRLLGLPPGEG
jgi:hypothetical protein